MRATTGRKQTLRDRSHETLGAWWKVDEGEKDLRISGSNSDSPFLSGQPTTQTTFSFDPKFAFSPLDWMSNTFDRSFGVEPKCVSLVTIPLAFLEG